MSARKLLTELESEVVLGCMRTSQMTQKDLRGLIDTSLENGITSFDHADIYGGGQSEALFGQVLAEDPALRQKMYIQSKCAIRKGLYDFSKDHILESVDGILKRLNTEYLDCLLLHRPDALMEPEEVADAFAQLKASGKVRRFGVSNMNSAQIELLQSYTDEKLAVDQLQLSIAHSLIVDEGLNVNMADAPGQMHAGSILEYCRLKKVGIQSWSSLQYGFFEGTFLGSDKYVELNRKLDTLSDKYNVTSGAIAIAWILRIPGVAQAVIGTTKAARVKELAKAGSITLTREEWYELYLSAGNRLP